MSEIEFKKIPVKQIELDVENPRVRPYLGIGVSQADPNFINKRIRTGLQKKYEALMDSIVELPGLVTPIIVTKESESKYKVLEGNTRLHIYHELKRRKIPGSGILLMRKFIQNLMMIK